MFAARITLPHFSVSSAMSLPKSAGEPGSGVSPKGTEACRCDPGSQSQYSLIAMEHGRVTHVKLTCGSQIGKARDERLSTRMPSHSHRRGRIPTRGPEPPAGPVWVHEINYEPRVSHGAPVHPPRRPCAKASSRSLNSTKLSGRTRQRGDAPRIFRRAAVDFGFWNEAAICAAAAAWPSR